VAVRYDLLQLAQSSGTFLSLLRGVVVVSCPEFASIVCQVWDSAADIAEQYQVGKVESDAAYNLWKCTDPVITEKLASMVAQPASSL
jgi:hypothetical protein